MQIKKTFHFDFLYAQRPAASPNWHLRFGEQIGNFDPVCVEDYHAVLCTWKRNTENPGRLTGKLNLNYNLIGALSFSTRNPSVPNIFEQACSL